ncbi:MAG: hypothetical protein H7X99_05580, partial [Saprospiraceae bacterium]|nr:hypothetical protein [Saprospiraceae bacterium]
EATKLGFNAYILGADISAEINELKNVIADKIMNYNADLPCCLIWGGEPTVKVNGHGKGGRNQHLVLSVLEMLIQEDIKNRFILLSSGTDGTDGPTDAAGAYIDENILKKAKNDPTELQSHLIAFDAYHFFERYGGLIKTGPTFTNVMDVIIVLISKE